jgi:hypothetical protein
MSSIQGKTRLAFLAFFISHLPITILVDGQAFLPRDWYPQSLVDVVDWYAATFKVCPLLSKQMSYNHFLVPIHH